MRSAAAAAASCAGLSFEVVSLERVVEGSNIPVPKTLIKSVLNLVMPSVGAGTDNPSAVHAHRLLRLHVCILQPVNRFKRRATNSGVHQMRTMLDASNRTCGLCVFGAGHVHRLFRRCSQNCC